MSSRYVYEHRKKGDVAFASPEALDAGKKLLGYLAEQRRLGLAKTLVTYATTADGSRVTARFIGDSPEVKVEAPPLGERRIPSEVFLGLVTAPRMFGTAAANDGQLAFGVNAQTILSGRGAPLEWRTGFYDQSYVPGSFTGRKFTYRQALPSGLALAGNIDWTNADHTIAVTWLGPKMRSLSLAAAPWAGINTTRRGPCVYCNGQVLVDHSLIDADEKIIGACISTRGGEARVVYAAYRHDWFGNDGNIPKVYAAPLRAKGTKFTPAAAADISLLATGTAYSTTEHKLWPCLFFNQDGTEGRMIRVFVDGSVGAGFTLHFAETVVTLNADGTASIAEVDRGHAQPAASGTVSMAVGPNMWNEAEIEFVDDGTGGADPVPPGIYASTYDTHYNTWTAITESNPSNTPDVVVNSGSHAYTMTCPGGPFPVAVDYEDSVPVYLYWAPGSITHDATYSASWTQDTTAAQTDERTYSYFPDSLDTHITHQVMHTAASVTANGNTTSSATDTVTGGTLYAQDKLGATWLNLSISKTSTESAIGSASLEQEKSFDGEYTWDDAGAPSGSTETRARSTILGSSLDTDVASSRTMAMLWWLDMRSKSAAYSTYTRATHEVVSTTVAASAADAIAASGYPSAAATTTTDTTTDSVTLDVDTRIVFFGAQVDAAMLHTSTDTPGTTIVSGSPLQRSPGDVLRHRFSVDADTHITVPECVPTEIHGDTLPTWVQTAKDSFPQAGDPPYASPTNLSQEVDGPTTNPGGGSIHYSSFEFQPVETTVDATGSFVYEDWAQWVVLGADREGTAVPTDSGHHNFGTWIAHNGLWAYSMPDLSDLTHADMSVPQYRFGVKGGASLDAITGARGAELFEFFWPLTPYTLTIPR